MQTILGAGGTIGAQLAKELRAHTGEIRLVSRNPALVNAGDQVMPADLTDGAAVDRAVAGSDVVYLTVGFEYKTKVWRAVWPSLMKNLVTACERHRAKLVFFDNVYAYEASAIPHMTEQSPIAPSSQKGKIRAETLGTLLDAVEKGRISALVARAADFYGPNSRGKSMLVETVYKNLRAGKAAIWLGDATKKHSFTYTPDAARATALLGNTPDAFNQSWHIPTDSKAPTGREWVELFARALGVEPRLRVMPAWMVGALGVFVPLMKELREMLYQTDRDYVFDSTKFEKRFTFVPTSPAEGVRQLVAADSQGSARTG